MSTENKIIPSPEGPKARRGKLPRALWMLGALVLAAFVVVACVESAPAGPVIPLIPDNAIAAVVIESPYKLFSSCDDFYKGAGLEAMLGAGFEQMLTSVVPNAGEAAQVLDFARPWAFAVIPSDNPDNPSLALYVPYRSDPEAFLQKLFGGALPLKVSAKAKNYIMLTEGQTVPAFPTAKAIDTKALARYPAGSLKLWGSVAAIADLAKDGYKPIDQAMREYLSDPSAASDMGLAADPMKMLNAMGDILLSVLGQLNTADAALVLNGDGLTVRMGAKAASKSDLQKLFAKASKGASALDWASQVDADALYGLAWAGNPADGMDFSKKYFKPLFESLGMDKAAVDAVFKYQEKYIKAAGQRGAMSFDFDIDADVIASAEDMDTDDPQAIADWIKDAMAFDIDAIMEVKNEAAYRALMKGYATDPDIKAFMKSYTELFGIELGFTSEDKKDGAFSYGELGFTMKMGDAAPLLGTNNYMSDSEKEIFDTMFDSLASMIKMRWTVAGKKCFITTNDAAALKALSTRKAADKSLASLPSFQAFSKAVPKKPVMVLSLSVSKLMDMVSDILEASGGLMAVGNSLDGLEGLGNWYSYVSVVDSSSFDTGFFIPVADIGAIVKFAVTMSQQQQQAQFGGDV